MWSTSTRAALHAREPTGEPGPRRAAEADRRAPEGDPAQVALEWLLAQKPWIVPIPGTTKLHRLEENLGGADITLAADDLRELDRLAKAVTIQGERYSESAQRFIDR